MTARIVFVICAAALTAFAQTEIEIPPPPEAGLTVAGPHVGVAVSGTFQAAVPAGGGDVLYFQSEMAPFGKTIKGAPYSADFVSEHVQTLSDGNVIRNKQTGSVSRDSEGRTRRDQPIGPIGMLGGLTMPPHASHPVFINDPVAGVNYVLDPETKTAQKLPVPKIESVTISGSGTVSGAGTAGAPVTQTFVAHTMAAPAHAPDAARESLGTKMIEGVQAEGSRTTFTIPAGEIGNDRPITTVTERWYSSQLQTVILTKTSDPRMGDSTYQLTNVNLAEPAHALFEVPADYKITDGPQPGTKMIMRKQIVDVK